jgi:hypothetical protein
MGTGWGGGGEWRERGSLLRFTSKRERNKKQNKEKFGNILRVGLWPGTHRDQEPFHCADIIPVLIVFTTNMFTIIIFYLYCSWYSMCSPLLYFTCIVRGIPRVHHYHILPVLVVVFNMFTIIIFYLYNWSWYSRCSPLLYFTCITGHKIPGVHRYILHV